MKELGYGGKRVSRVCGVIRYSYVIGLGLGFVVIGKVKDMTLQLSLSILLTLFPFFFFFFPIETPLSLDDASSHGIGSS